MQVMKQQQEATKRALALMQAGSERRSPHISNQEIEDGDHDSDSDPDDEEKLQKARYWDDFKDKNPAGWGNTMGNMG